MFEQKSDVIPVVLKKDGALSEAFSRVASTDEFAILSEYVNHSIVRAGNEIYKGNVKVAPFVGKTSGCTYCPYKAICGFDYKIEGYEERKGHKIDKKEIFERMETDNALDRRTAKSN